MANTPINKVQPMREAEQDIADYLNGTVAPYMVNETAERKAADTQLQKNLDAETSRAKAAEKVLTDDLAAEVSRAKSAENTITTNLNTEVTRAKGAEKVLTDDLAEEVTRATAAEKANADAISAETNRATASEQANADAITGETSRAKAVEDNLQSNINAEYTRATNAENALSDRVGVVEGKFPIQTVSIGDAQVTEGKLSSDLQTLLTFCKTLPDFAFGYSDSQTITKGTGITVEIPFGKTFSEIPEVIPTVDCNTDLNVLTCFVKYSTTTSTFIKVYNGGTTDVSNVNVGFLALAGR